ncbi:hypothetical protein [Staphylococcus saprophyticus]|uniref:hypothetical protein n=1 Tax=Staphylococcus saprophyticus TaxID=29385 RepID=UPI00203AA007|nr:hypothetical protein [Staphylococcus saprophyticus]MCM3121457.1 hypothetical protein [Staphylococcus saprophyticus]
MNTKQLLDYLNYIGLNVQEVGAGIYKGHSCNVKQWHSFRIWINKSGNVTIKSHGVQRSFKLQKINELERELRGFEII